MSFIFFEFISVSTTNIEKKKTAGKVRNSDNSKLDNTLERLRKFWRLYVTMIENYLSMIEEKSCKIFNISLDFRIRDKNDEEATDSDDDVSPSGKILCSLQTDLDKWMRD